MGVEIIINKILGDAKETSEALLKKAKEEGTAIISQAMEEGNKEKSLILIKANEEAQKTYDRAIAAAEMEGKKRILSFKQKMIDEVLEKTISSIENMCDEEYQNLLSRLIIERAKGNEEILLSPRDKKRMSPDFLYYINRQISKDGETSNMTLSDETKDIRCGFVMRSGDIELNFSLMAIANALRDDLEHEILQNLFN